MSSEEAEGKMGHLTAALAAAQSAMEQLQLEWHHAAEQQQEQHSQELAVLRRKLDHGAGELIWAMLACPLLPILHST
jgi:hypothetical protein